MIRTWNRCFSVAKRKKLPFLTRFGYQTFLLTFFNQNWRHNYRFVSYNYFFGYR